MSCIRFVRAPTVELRPEEIPKFALDGLLAQRSFRFSYRLWRKAEPRVELEFKGLWAWPHQESRQGYQCFNSDSSRIWIMGLEDIEYERRGKEWVMHPRGEETELLAQLERVVTPGKFQLIEETKDEFKFRFQPNLAFLDPEFKKEISGIMRISKSNYLPTQIATKDSNEDVGLVVEFWDYNRPKRLRPPVPIQLRIRLGYPELASDAIEELHKRILNRLVHCGISARFEPEAFILTEPISQARIESILVPGRVELYHFQPGQGLGERIFGPEGFGKAKIEFDHYKRPFIRLTPSPIGVKMLKGMKREEVWGLVLDGALLASGRFDRADELRIISWSDGLCYFDFVRLAAIINSGPLPAPVSVIEMEGLSW